MKSESKSNQTDNSSTATNEENRATCKFQSINDASSNQKISDRKRKLNIEAKESNLPTSSENKKRDYHSFTPLTSTSVLNHRALGNLNHSNFSKLQKAVVINYLNRFEVRELSCPFERRVTAIAWHPKYPLISVAGSKGGDLLFHNLRNSQDHFFPGIGAGGSVLGLKFCNTDPCVIYTACMRGKICMKNFRTKMSKDLACILVPWDNWFTCLDICYNRNFLLSGDCNGNSYLLKTSGEMICMRKKLHTSKITHCEFNANDPNIFVTSSLDRSVKLWDLRSISESGLKPQPLLEFTYDKGVHSACFSPSSYQNLVVTDQHSQLRLYSSPCWNETAVITHPHRHYQHISPIKAMWHPLEDIVVVGRYPDENVIIGDQRTIDFYDGSTGELLYRKLSPSKHIVSLNTVNSTGDTIFLAAGHHVVYMQDKNILNGVSCSHGSDSESENSKVDSNAFNIQTNADESFFIDHEYEIYEF